jgi:hypothetical protein
MPILVDTPLAQGLIVCTDGPDTRKVKFALVDAYVVPSTTIADARGFYTIPAVAECTLTGPVGNVAQDTIVKVEGAPSGIDVLYNAAASPVLAGDFEESEASKNSRIKAHETGANQMWTSEWYQAEALAYAEVWRTIYISSRALGIPGLSKLLITSKTTTAIQSVIDALYNDLNTTEDKNSGAGLVQVENIPRVDVNKTVRVKFSDAGQIKSQTELDLIWENYFMSLVRGQAFVDNQLKSLYFNFFGVIDVTFTPPGDVSTTSDQLATPGTSFNVIGEVFA